MERGAMVIHPLQPLSPVCPGPFSPFPLPKSVSKRASGPFAPPRQACWRSARQSTLLSAPNHAPKLWFSHSRRLAGATGPGGRMAHERFFSFSFFPFLIPRWSDGKVDAPLSQPPTSLGAHHHRGGTTGPVPPSSCHLCHPLLSVPQPRRQQKTQVSRNEPTACFLMGVLSD